MMIHSFGKTATDSGSLVVLMIGLFAFGLAVLATRLGRSVSTDGGDRRAGSLVGVGLQAVAFFACAMGPMDIHDWVPSDLARTLAVATLMVAGVALFAWAARTMGANWAIVARTRADHELITGGPFAWMRNPIYLAMALVLVAVAVATAHLPALGLAAPLFAIGTAIRVRAEERLLEKRFGADYRSYAARVKRFIPGLF